MPVVRVLYSSSDTVVREVRRRRRKDPRPRVGLQGESGRRTFFNLAPSEMDLSGLARSYEQFERIGRKPLLERGEKGLRVYTFTVMLVHRDRLTKQIDPEYTVAPQINRLKNLAQSGERIQWVNFGRVEKGTYRMTNLSISVVRRNERREITVATASIELTEAVDVALRLGPTTGGASPPPRSRNSTARNASADSERGGRRITTYVVKRGDTLSGIALRLLGSASRYKEIADTNKISNPNLIRVGQTLRIVND